MILEQSGAAGSKGVRKRLYGGENLNVQESRWREGRVAREEPRTGVCVWQVWGAVRHFTVSGIGVLSASGEGGWEVMFSS